jgi:hypothetical protein
VESRVSHNQGNFDHEILSHSAGRIEAGLMFSEDIKAKHTSRASGDLLIQDTCPFPTSMSESKTRRPNLIRSIVLIPQAEIYCNARMQRVCSLNNSSILVIGWSMIFLFVRPVYLYVQDYRTWQHPPLTQTHRISIVWCTPASAYRLGAVEVWKQARISQWRYNCGIRYW